MLQMMKKEYTVILTYILNDTFYFKMGRRAQLFMSARECVNVLACPKPTNELYKADFGLCMIFTTRLKLINILHSLLHKMYKCKCKGEELKLELLRYYKLNKIHTFQLEKYKREHKNLFNNFVFRLLRSKKLGFAVFYVITR